MLKKSPEALGTYTYLFVLRCIVDSYITKDIEPLVRIEKAWTAIFFLRYWRKWIEDNPSYTINKNFVTYNAYLCCELNGHSLISFVITLRDHGDSKSEFIPWVLGSQSCEKMFCSARSMSTVFSTMINFGMLGLLCRLHRLNIQLQLECNKADSAICYPHSKYDKVKVGNADGHSETVIAAVCTNENIEQAVDRGRRMAQTLAEGLGIKLDCWENPPIYFKCEGGIDDHEDHDINDDEFECDREDEKGTINIDDVISEQERTHVIDDVSMLAKHGLVSKCSCDTVVKKLQ